MKTKNLSFFKKIFKPKASMTPGTGAAPPVTVDENSASLEPPAACPDNSTSSVVSTPSAGGVHAAQIPLSPLGMLLAQLRAAVARLPDTVPIGCSTDTLATLAVDPSVLHDEEGPGRAVNRALDAVLQDGARSLARSEIASLVRRGPSGMDAVCAFLEGAAAILGPQGAMLEPRVERFRDAVATLIPSEAELHATGAQPQQSIGAPVPAVTTQPSTLPMATAVAIVSSSNPPSAATPITQNCHGIKLAVPPGQSGHTAYPFGLHTVHNLPWDVHLVNNALIVQSTRCRKVFSGTATACDRCTAVLSHTTMKGILDRMERGVHDHTRLHYHSVDGLIKIVRKKSKTIKALRLTTLGQSRKLLSRARTLDEHKKFVMAVGSGEVPRLHALVRTALRCKAGIGRIVALVDAAGKRVYKPKGYTEEEKLRGILFLRMGGARVAELAHRTCGLPGVSTLRHSSLTQPLHPSPSTPRADEVDYNIKVSFPEPSEPQVETLAVLMFDELKVTDAARWCPSTNKILGFCREHSKGYTMDFATMKEVDLLCDGLNKNDVHLASEATVAAIGKLCGNTREYSARPVLISGTCKKETGPEQATVIQTVLDACVRQQARTGCRIISVASDGESRRGLAFELLFLKHSLSPSSPIYELLADLGLFNIQTGANDITMDKDWKHVMKRLRNMAIRRSGFVVHGTHITPAQIRRHLSASGATQSHLDSIMNPSDKQDVVLMFTLLRDIWSLPAPSASDLPGFAATRNALRLFGRLCYYIVAPYLLVNLSLSEQLEYLSSAAHLALDVFTYGDSHKEGLSARMVLDIMHMVKNAYFCVAKTKVADPNGNFWLLLLGTDRLETAFGILRTIVGNDANADVFQLGTRFSHVVECANIFARFPHWDRGPRRLHLAPMTSSGQVSRDADHLNPSSWKGDVCVRDVVLKTCWKRGRAHVEAEFAASGIKERLSRIDRTPGANILAPLGVPLAGPDAEELFDEDDEEEDDTDADTADSEPAPTRRRDDLDMDLEDVVGAQECASSSFSATVAVGEKNAQVYKARALRECIQFRAADSTDRIHRIAKKSRYNNVQPSSDYIDDFSALGSDALCVDDPIATLVVCEKRLFGCIGQVIALEHDSHSLQMIKSELLSDSAVSVRFRILQLAEVAGGEPDEWRWNGRYDGVYTAPGRLVEPVDPAIVVTQPGSTTFSFQKDDLCMLAIALYDRLSKADAAHVPEAKRTTRFPYRTGDYACFACEKEGRDTADTLGERFCPRCEPAVPVDWNDAPRVLEHMACHQLFDRGVDTSQQLCGYCLRPAPLCLFYLRKGKGADSGHQVDFRRGKSRGCERARPFKYAFASKSTAHSPCSNVPIICPRCPVTQPAVWKYNFLAHLRQAHPSASVDDYKPLYELSGSEVEGLRALWNTRHNPRRVSRKSTKVELKISDDHRAVVPLSKQKLRSSTNGDVDMVSDGEDDCEDGHSSLADDDDDESSESDSDVNESDGGSTGDMSAEFDVGCPSASSDAHQNGTPPATCLVNDKPTGTLVDCSPVPDRMDAAPAAAAVGSEPERAGASPFSAAPKDAMVAEEEPEHGRRSRRQVKRRLGRDACICGKVVTDEEIGLGKSVIECPARGCETQWYHMECHNFQFKPKSWKCDSCVDLSKATKRRKVVR